MKRALIAVGLIALGAGGWACDSDDNGKAAAPTPPPPPQQGGELGIAEFTYKCLLPSDPQCDFDQQVGTGTATGGEGSLPQLATGSTFGLTDTIIGYEDAGPGAPPVLTALHPDFLTISPDGTTLTPIKAGKSTLGLNRGTEVVDMIDIEAVDPDGPKLFAADPQGNFTKVTVNSDGSVTAKGTFTFKFRIAMVKGDDVLAGSFPCKWSIVGDTTIANFVAGADTTDNIISVVTGVKAGTVTLHADYGTTKADIQISSGGS